jgi:eukaryotic-like serine/threonine-protein kinase
VTNTEPLIAGRYRLVTALGAGAMGVVWKGWDERLHRQVAIKQLRLQPGLSPSEAANARERAMREARITARLHHPHAVPVYDVVEHDGQPCIIMQFVPSISLQEALAQRGTLPPVEVARIGSEVATALIAAHHAGIVHRDVKPGNVLLAEDGAAKLTDFGISHVLGDVTLTATGMVTGTPAYLAPEVARGQSSSFASDVFSLGSTLYTATEGSPPFGQDANAMAVLHRVASGQLDPPQRSGPLTPLLLRMLTDDPQARPTMTDVSHTLAALHADSTALQTSSGRASSLATARLKAPLPSPSQTTAAPKTLADARPVVLPAPARPSRRRGLTGALMAGALVVGVVLLAIALTNRDGRNSPKSAAAGPATTSAPTQASSAPRSANASATTGQTPSGSMPGRTATAATAGQLAQAITDYYGLVPKNLQEAWTRLTPAYQNSHAGGLSGYQQFWSEMKRVSVSNASGQLPNSVQATITYVYKDHRVVSERTAYQLAMSGGQWKIDNSTVLSSQRG